MTFYNYHKIKIHENFYNKIEVDSNDFNVNNSKNNK